MRIHRILLLATLCLLPITACSPAAQQLIGDPQDPYPLKSPPKVGDIEHLPTGTIVSMAQMISVAGDSRVVFVGETHDNPASHRLELQVLQGLARRHPGRLALGMEMFTRSQQPILDRWIDGTLDEKHFLKEVRWFETWNMDFGYYRDLLNFAREEHIPLIALNAEKDMVRAVRTKKPDQLSAEQQARLPKLDLDDPYHRGLVEAIFSGHTHGNMNMDGFVRAQTLWDETMAESVVNYLKSPGGEDKHLLVIAGGDHVNYGFGIPRRVFQRLPVSYTLITGREINIKADKEDRLMDVELPDFPMVPTDFLAYLAYEDLPKTGVRLGVMAEPVSTGRGLEVKNVLPGSNAERAGLRQGDLLLSIDGQPIADNFDLVYPVQQKHPGDHAKLGIERQGQPLTLDVTFQTGQKHP